MPENLPAATLQEVVLKQIAREYNTLAYVPKLVNLLGRLYPQESFEGMSKLHLHQKLNEIILSMYFGEHQLKYKLYSLYSDVFNRNTVAAFEIRVNKSRADFLTVNGVSKCYEIKSSLDTLSKLKKQSEDYVKVFDYNYIVTDARHLAGVEKIVPESFGIWSFNNGKRKIHRGTKENKKIEPEIQLRLLTKRELISKFAEEQGTSKKILIKYSGTEINTKFKQVLKDRYKHRWRFVVANRDQILPIDLQFFFNTNIKPEYIYLH